MDNSRRPETMQRITTPDLAQAFIDEQLAALREQIGEQKVLLELFEETFDHKAFTGRSGTFFAYEGLGSIYWHMVSKLLVATQECYFQALDAQAPETAALAKHYHAVLAVNRDFFSMTPSRGITIRQGHGYFIPKEDKHLTYRDGVRYDLLLIDEKGDLHILKQASMEDIYQADLDVINSFTFGPGLVIVGERQSNFYNYNNAPTHNTQRICIAQVGPLEYLCICCEGPDDDDSTGMTLEQFTDLIMTQEGVINAYNLDGGGSSTMVFHGKKINSNPKVNRSLVDILYFASAYVPD